MMERILVFTLLLFSVNVSSVGGDPDEPAKGIRTVVIDAGHGGRDPGAQGRLAKEKDLALAIALKVGRYIEEYMPEVEVVYTRKTDVFVQQIGRAHV